MDINGVALTQGGITNIKEANIKGTKTPTIVVSATATPRMVEKNDNGLTPFEQKAADGVQGMKITRDVNRGVEPTREERVASWTRMAEIFIRELPTKTEQLNRQFSDIEKKVEDKIGDAANSEWDFSIDKNGAVVVVGEDLSDKNKEVIEKIIGTSGLMEGFSSLKSVMIEMLEEDRTTALYSSSIGKYDLTSDNFSDIIYFKDFLQSAGDDGNPHKVGEALVQQLKARADEEYNKKPEAIDVYV